MNRRNFTKSMVAVTGLAALSSRVQATPGSQPNLLFVFPDQMRMFSMGIWSDTAVGPGGDAYNTLLNTVGDPVHTPNIDQLAKDGVLFTQACSTRPVCSPYRAMLMSGMYAERNGVSQNCYVNRDEGLRHDIEGFTDILYNCGYETGYVGKVHWEKNEELFDSALTYVGPSGTTTPHNYDTYIPAGPGRHGNKFWFQHLSDSHNNAMSYANKSYLIAGKTEGQMHRANRFTPEHEASVVVDFINNTNGERDVSKPFSMFWAPNPPHSPYANTGDVDVTVYNAHYAGKTNAELALRDNYVNNASKQDKYMPFYFSNVTSIDEHFGRIMQALEDSGEASNTIVVFTSDHGEMMGSNNKMTKNKFYEEAYLVPFILYYPGQSISHIEDLMITPVDIMPTLLSMMGLKDQVPLSVQGRDYSHGILTGDHSQQPRPASAPYFKGRGSTQERGIRTAGYTYMVKDERGTITTELYDLTTDPYQMNNLPLGSIPAGDLTFLQSELGFWIKKSENNWYTDNKNPSYVTYPPGDHLNMKSAGADIQFDVPKDGTVYVKASTNLVNGVSWQPVGTNTTAHPMHPVRHTR